MSLLAGKRLLVTGVLTRGSIAFEVARQAQEHGATVVLSGFGRGMRLTERAAKHLPAPPDVLELDVNQPADALGGGFLDTPAQSAITAFETSAFSLKALAAALAPLLEAGEGGGSVVGLDFDAAVAWPVYDWMGVAKAALESVSRYLARDLGPRGIRCNLVSAGPIETIAAGGIPGFEDLAGLWRAGAPLGWDTRDAAPVAAAVCFLLSDLARGITGEILHVDGGFHAMGAPLR